MDSIALHSIKHMLHIPFKMHWNIAFHWNAAYKRSDGKVQSIMFGSWEAKIEPGPSSVSTSHPTTRQHRWKMAKSRVQQFMSTSPDVLVEGTDLNHKSAPAVPLSHCASTTTIAPLCWAGSTTLVPPLRQYQPPDPPKCLVHFILHNESQFILTQLSLPPNYDYL